MDGERNRVSGGLAHYSRTTQTQAVIYVICAACATVAFAAEHSAAPPDPPTARHIDRLIRALGDGDYFVRQKAEADLGKMGFDAVDALTAAADSDDMEVAIRVARLLFSIRSNWASPGDPSDVVSLLARYETQDDNVREFRVGQLLELPHAAGIPAICRIIRFERSLPLAKLAALRLVESISKGGDAKKTSAAVIERTLGDCSRRPARWVVAWLRAKQDSTALATLWTDLLASEEELLLQQPRETSLDVVEQLLRMQIAALRKISRGADAQASLARLIRLRRDDPGELAVLLRWFIDQKDWAATMLMEARCRPTIVESADLLYLLAEAQTLRGDAPAAALSAVRALRLNPGDDDQSLASHFQCGESLERRGRFDWAMKEWEHVIHAAQPHSPLAVIAARSLSELYHDRDEDGRAAETLAGITGTFVRRTHQWTLIDQEGGDVTLGALRSRRLFFQACDCKARGDRAKEREYLDKALATHAYDIEVLIACHQLPDSPAAYREKIHGLIEKKLCALREQIADMGPYGERSGEAAQPCNEFAWLTANTEGDLDEALRLAKRAVELAGDERGAYVDTLARVYFAKGDYAAAVKQQTRAAELMPYNRAVQRQLESFRKKAREKGIKLESIEKLEKPAMKTPPPTREKTREDNPFG